MSHIAFFSEKLILSDSGEKYEQIKQTFNNSSKHICEYCCERTKWGDFFTEGNIIKDWYFGKKQQLKNVHSFLLHNIWSAVWALILTAPIHCRGSIAEQVTSHVFFLLKKLTHLLYILDGWKVNQCLANINFCVNDSVKYLHRSRPPIKQIREKVSYSFKDIWILLFKLYCYANNIIYIIFWFFSLLNRRKKANNKHFD